MGYRSDVKFVVAFPSETLRDEVLAIYSMHPKVQELDLASQWVKYEETDTYYRGDRFKHSSEKEKFNLTAYVLMYDDEHVKWYPDYIDVQAVEHMFEVIKMRAEKDDEFPFAWKRIRVGEEVGDIEVDTNYNDDCLTSDLLDTFLDDRFYVSTNIECELKQDEAR